MWELRATVKSDKWAAEDCEVNENLGALLISRRFCRRDPIICKRTIGEDARIENGSFAGTTIEPKAGSHFHMSRLMHQREIDTEKLNAVGLR